MGLINRLYTFATTPGVDPAIGAQIDAEINQILNLVNGALDNFNLGGNPDIDSSKLSLGGAGFLPLGGGSLTAVLNHLFSGTWRTMGASGGVLTREYRDTGAGVAWGLAYNTYYTGSGWAGRDVSDICMRMELTTSGMFRFYWAPSAGSGVSPVWYPGQYMTPMGGHYRNHDGSAWSSPVGDVIYSSDPAISGIFHYNTLTLNAGVTWTLQQGKPLIIFARESVTINGTIDGNGKGATGGTSLNTGASGAAGSFGSGGASGNGSGGSGNNGGGTTLMWNSAAGGIGGSGVGGNGNPAVAEKQLLSDLGYKGGGGGGGAGVGGSGGYQTGGSGGNGGGFVCVVAPKIILTSGSVIRCNGQSGFASPGGNYGGGGGGGGGGIFISCKTITHSATLTVSGGSGGAGSGSGDAGGNGGAGLIYIEELL